MELTLQSTRFGALTIAAESVIEFPDGLIGLGGSRYTLLTRDEDSAFVWLHSLDDPELALPVTQPWPFFPDYEVRLSDGESERVGITDPAMADVWVTVRAAPAIEDFTVNLRAPILISEGRGYQVINEADDAPVRVELLSGAAAGEDH